MVEEPLKMKKKDQVLFDEQEAIAQRLQEELQAELEKEERMAKQIKDDANIAEWDDVQAMMDADYELAARLQAQEQGELTIKERFTHNQLKNKSFNEVQKAFDKTMSWIDSFVPMDSEVVKGSKDKAEGSKKRTRKGLDKKVARDKSWRMMQKRQSLNFIKRADGSYKMYKIFSEMLNDFDRQDLIDLYSLVTERFKITRPEGSDKLLWGDLMTIFEPSEEDELWRNQQDYILIS
ncbi:hypothetical protein Tco_0966169 [Tanacetum coccineum]